MRVARVLVVLSTCSSFSLQGQTKFIKTYGIGVSEVIPAGAVAYPDRYVIVAGIKDNSVPSIAV